MPKGIPAAGFRRTKAYTAKTIQELDADLQAKAPRIIEELERLTKPLPCPHCGNKIEVIDKEVGMYLLNRAMGMPKQRQEVDITQQIELSADQVEVLVQRLRETNPQFSLIYDSMKALPGPTEYNKDSTLSDNVIEGEYEADHD